MKRIRTLPTFLLAMSCASFGCGDDGGGGMASDAAVTAADADPNAPDAAPPVTISGTITDEDDAPIANLSIEVFGAMPANSTTTDTAGDWSLLVSPGDVILLTSGTGYWSSVNLLSVPAAGLSGLDRFEPIAEADVAGVDEELTDRTIDEAKGIVAVGFGEESLGGESATLSLDADAPFTFIDDAPVVQGTSGGPDSELVFTNVTLGSLTTMVMGASGQTSCSLPSTVMPVLAKTITEVRADCTAL